MQSKLIGTATALALGTLLYLADTTTGGHGLTLLREARAVVGAPATPMSVAGVARRTTRRVVAVEATAAAGATSATAQQQAATAQQQQAVAEQQAATAQQQAAVAQQQAGAPAVGSIVTTLPPGCTQTTRNGVAFQYCGGVYYRAAFQGNNLVYVVEQP